MKNAYEILGSAVRIQLPNRYGKPPQFTVVDLQDLALVANIPGFWRANWNHGSKTFYVTTTFNHQTISLHRLLLATAVGMEVDHDDHDGLNNRRHNIKNVSHQQNMLNRRAHRRWCGRWIEIPASRSQRVTPTGDVLTGETIFRLRERKMTFREIGAQWGISKQRIHQIWKDDLRKAACA